MGYHVDLQLKENQGSSMRSTSNGQRMSKRKNSNKEWKHINNK